MPRVLFYFFKNVHAPVLLPIYHELRKDPQFEIGICSPFDQYIREQRAGFKEGEETILPAGEVPLVRTPQEWHSDVVFIADSVTHQVQGCGKIINVGHGLLSKGQYFTDTDFIDRENLEHLLLVPGEFHKQTIKNSRRIFIPVEAVGYPKLDALFKPGAPSRDELCRMIGLDPAKKIILYAPTFNISLSTIPVIWTRIKELATPDTCLLMKFHGSTLPEFVDAHVVLTEQNPNIYLISDLDITPYLQVADVMVSDVSSAFLEFVLLDKPVVLFNNPNIKEYINYDPRDVEYTWRDVGVQVTSLEGMKRAVARSLEKPEELSQRRHYYIEKMGIKLDGNASKRVRELTWELIDGRIEQRRLHKREKVTVVLTGEYASVEIVAESVTELSKDCGIDVSFVVVDQSFTQDNQQKVELSTGSLLRFVSANDLQTAIGDSDYLCMVGLGAQGWDRWLFRLVNHLRRDPSLEAVVPLTSEGEKIQRPETYIRALDKKDYTEETTDALFKSSLVTKSIPLDSLPLPDLGLVRLGTYASQKAIDRLNGMDINPFSDAKLALDVVMYIPEIESQVTMVRGDVLDGLEADVAPRNAAEYRITRLAAEIGSIMPDEPETEKTKRLGAEAHLRLARHYMGRGRHDQAVNEAKVTLELYPKCTAARYIIEQMQPLTDCQIK